MASKFGLGTVSFRVVNGHFPGKQLSKTVNRIVKPALLGAANDHKYEFGEIVEVVGDTKSNWIVKPISATTTASSKLGVIMEEITGGTNVFDDRIITAKKNVAINLWDLDKNLDSIVVSLQGTQVPVLGNQIYVGNGTKGTIAGAVYTAQVDTTGCVAPTGLVFASEAFTPSTTDARTIAIRKK